MTYVGNVVFGSVQVVLSERCYIDLGFLHGVADMDDIPSQGIDAQSIDILAI
jgi:hypothetical protein